MPGTVRAAAVLMAVSGAVHFALIPHHLATDPFTSLLFLINGVAFITLANLFTWRWWRLAAAALLISTVLGYLLYVGIGFEGPDQVGLATKLVEVAALGLALVPLRSETGRTHPTHRTLRWATLGVAMPLLIVITGATVWIVDLARPDAPLPRHRRSTPRIACTRKRRRPSSHTATGTRRGRPDTVPAARPRCPPRTG